MVEGTMREEAHESLQSPSNFENNGLPLTERILEEEDWLDDGGDADCNDFGDDDADLMEEDDLLGEDLQAEEDKRITPEDSGIEKSNMEAALTFGDGSNSGSVANSGLDSKNSTPRKAVSSPASRGSVPSTKKKRGSRSPSTIGVSLRQRNFLAGLGSPKALGPGHGPIGTKTGQSGQASSDVQKKARGAVETKTNITKVANGTPPKVP